MNKVLGETPKKHPGVTLEIPEKESGAFDEGTFFYNKQQKEKYLAEKAKVDAETKRLEHAVLRGKLVKLDVAQAMLEKEHTRWLNAIEDWRQAIAKKIGRLGVPVETQEAINDMILKEVTSMRSKRAVANG